MKPLLACVSFLLCAVAPAGAAEVFVAVAANFAGPMREIAVAFERRSGHRAVLAVGSTGSFYAQIRGGAPFQVLVAADQAIPARLEREGLAVPGTRFTYAIGRLVLWSREPGLVDDRGDVLRRGRFSRIALAEPRLAPYGAAAVETLTSLGLLARLQPRFVRGEDVAQAYQFVATGNAELGFVAQGQVFADGRLRGGSAWIVPPQLYTPIRQDALVLAAGRDEPAAFALARFLRGAQARRVIVSHGYGT